MSQLISARTHPALETPRLLIRFFDPSRTSDYEDLLSVYEALRAVRDIGNRDLRTPADVDALTEGKAVPASLLPKSIISPPTHVWTLVYLKSASSSTPQGETSDREKPGISRATIVGHVSVFYISGGDGTKLGYALKPVFWGHGYATEAGREILRYYSEDLGLKTIRATAKLDNVASMRVLIKLGGRKMEETRDRPSEGETVATPENEEMVTYEWHFGQGEHSLS